MPTFSNYPIRHTAKLTQAILILLSLTLLPTAVVWVAKHQAQPQPAAAPTARLQENYGRVPLHFEANQGQYQQDVKYLTRGNGYSIALTPQAAVLELHNEKTATVQMKLKGANPNARITSSEPLEAKMNYFLGNDPKDWKTDVPTFAKVKYEQVYPGTDVVYYGNQQQLEYDFIIAPQADPSAIKLGFAGVNAMRLDEAGNLLLTTDAGEVKQHKPIIYQEVAGERRTVAGGYRIENNEASFAIGEYDRSLPLIIDPVIAYATYVNGKGDEGNAIAVDTQGNAYITGRANASSITTPGAIKSPPSNSTNPFVYVAKFNTTGTKLLYAALIGGVSFIRDTRSNKFVLQHDCHSLAVDGEGNAYVTGYTMSADFPTTAGALQRTYKPSSLDPAAAFVFKLNPTGTGLVYSTLLGTGSTGNALAVDAEGQAVVTGNVAADLPLKGKPFKPPIKIQPRWMPL
ncbi:MAG: SBBP repeat-containing protein [Blastocatellia bacterium]